jgi:ADP-ribosyl-[dinitrogen reductase] hydrolase
MQSNKVLGGLFGLCVGDALGVPVEFCSRKRLKEKPVTDMVGYGSHNQPPGTWSDDSSLAFCLAESLCHGFNLQDIADKFCKWLYEAYWTPHGNVFDVGVTTKNAIYRLKKGINPVEAGERIERSNGNGSLMRILPLAYYVENMDEDKKFEIIHQVSCLTHAHPRSQMACSIYIQMAINLLKGDTPKIAYEKMKNTIIDYYVNEPYKRALPHFSRILQEDISKYSETEIESSAYVIHTLEASTWCLLKCNSYEETVLTAVNLGGDTDTTGAVAGGLAGIYYGFENIPTHWINQIARKDDIMKLANRL